MDKEAVLAKLAWFIDSPELATIPKEVPPRVNVPESWLNILRQDLGAKRDAVLDGWRGFDANVPSAAHFVRTRLQDVLILLQRDSPSLLYVYTADKGDINFFEGHLPLQETAPKEFNAVWQSVPQDLRRFYSEAHNGWTFLASNAMGPLPLRDWRFLSESQFDLDSDTIARMPVDPQQVVTVFHNGAGDYLCLNLADCNENGIASGLVYWHEKPTEPDFVDFWPAMNTWLSIFLENADPYP
ncbi:hypothetical protein WJ70_22965 [Burkholderia ubonensis]|uniref:SMI1/KNR4 family protein n=1 Tax=Burkholderia ubonensis TaxID=101571 RepID=UPI00075A4267|nr:SMI1/KNR4 family protein [Burkholderia ubonensis]KVO08070.1 hypothetical protein WJ70_22965 [Burkholderia ubonensis]